MNYIKEKEDMILFLYKEIDRYVKEADGPEKLSILIGHTRTHIRMTLDRGKITSLEKLWKEIKKHYEN